MSEILDPNKTYFCPFCLIELQLRYFIKVGKHFVKCPDCNQKYKRNILIVDLTMYELGQWHKCNMILFNQPNRPYRDRINRENFYGRLNNFFPKYMRQEYWEGYNYIKENWDKDGIKIYELLFNKINSKKYKEKTLLTYNEPK